MLKPHVPSKLYPDLNLASWGINQETLQSWDIYTPIQDPESNSSTEESYFEPVLKPELKDSITNTSSYDFALLNSTELDPLVKVLFGTVRDINNGLSKLSFAPKKKAVLDKSCETGEDFLIDNVIDKNKDMEQLVSVFPDVPLDYLKEIYEKCHEDVNWTVDLLCEDNKLALATPKVEKEVDFCENIKKDVSDGIYDIKKTLEEKLELCGEKIMKFTNSVLGIQEAKDPQPSTSRFETCSTPVGDVVVIDSDVEMDELDFDITQNEEQQQMMEINLGETLVTELENKLKEPSFIYPKGFQPIVQMPVALARQLYAFYIESVYQQLDAQKEILHTLVKEDEEFAKKLQEQENNLEKPPPAANVTLTEIMDEQLALSINQKNVDKWKNLTPDTLAAKLTKKKLFETFPSVDPGVLVEIWQAHGNNYEETVESILASNPGYVNGSKESVMEPPIANEVVEEMKEAHENSQQVRQNL